MTGYFTARQFYGLLKKLKNELYKTQLSQINNLLCYRCQNLYTSREYNGICINSYYFKTIMKKPYMMRQGDLLLIEIDQLPQGLKKRGGNVILFGESTGNAHRLNGGDIYEDGELLYLQIVQPIGEVYHEEHRKIDLPAGNYQVRRQRQYTSEEAIPVVD